MPALRILARLMLLLAMLLGLSLGLAWAWDRSDPPATSVPGQGIGR